MTNSSPEISFQSWNDFDPLVRVIVGVADDTCIPIWDAELSENIVASGNHEVALGRRSQDTIDLANSELDNFCKILVSRGIRVDRPIPLDWTQPIRTPFFETGTMYGCMPPRDCLLQLGSKMIVAPMSFRCRYWEHFAYHHLMLAYMKEDPDFSYEAAPKPMLSDRSYTSTRPSDNLDEASSVLTHDFALSEFEPLFDAADVLRLGKDVFYQRSLTTNCFGMDWLSRRFPNHRFHPIEFPDDPNPIHIDSTLLALRPGLVLSNPTRPMTPKTLDVFCSNDWEVLEAAWPNHSTSPPLCFSSVWLSMNILSIDHKTVCIEASEVNLQNQLDDLGFEVIPIPFRNVYAFGGGLHCSTLDVSRKGLCEDYFPNFSNG